MKQTEISEPTIFLNDCCTEEEFKEHMANIRDVIVLLLKNAKGFRIHAQLLGDCFDFLGVIDTWKIVEGY